jgi:hypothetical protein
MSKDSSIHNRLGIHRFKSVWNRFSFSGRATMAGAYVRASKQARTLGEFLTSGINNVRRVA